MYSEHTVQCQPCSTKNKNPLINYYCRSCYYLVLYSEWIVHVWISEMLRFISILMILEFSCGCLSHIYDFAVENVRCQLTNIFAHISEIV